MDRDNTVVIPTKASLYFAKKIAKTLHIEILDTERQTFGEVEHYYRIVVGNSADLFGKDIIFVGSTHSDLELLEMYRVGCALSGYGARRIIFCIPFAGYSTMERAVKPGEIVTFKTVARQLSIIPQAAMGNTFLMLDLHVGGTIHYFEGDCTRFELYSEKQLELAIDYLIEKNELGVEDTVMASADLGRAKWVETFAHTFDTDVAFVQKGRDGEKTEVKRVIGDVTRKHVIIYDDMTRSAGTLIKAAHAYLKARASSVSVVLSHLALNNEGIIKKLVDSPIANIIATNSHPASQWSIVQSEDKFEIVDVSDVFTDLIEKILV